MNRENRNKADPSYVERNRGFMEKFLSPVKPQSKSDWISKVRQTGTLKERAVEIAIEEVIIRVRPIIRSMISRGEVADICNNMMKEMEEQ